MLRDSALSNRTLEPHNRCPLFRLSLCPASCPYPRRVWLHKERFQFYGSYYPFPLISGHRLQAQFGKRCAATAELTASYLIETRRDRTKFSSGSFTLGNKFETHFHMTGSNECKSISRHPSLSVSIQILCITGTSLTQTHRSDLMLLLQAPGTQFLEGSNDLPQTLDTFQQPCVCI